MASKKRLKKKIKFYDRYILQLELELEKKAVAIIDLQRCKRKINDLAQSLADCRALRDQDHEGRQLYDENIALRRQLMALEEKVAHFILAAGGVPGEVQKEFLESSKET